MGSEFDFASIYQKHFVCPEPFCRDQLLSNKNQVAGHAGFYSIKNEPKYCLKPINTNCVRGRREHLFYQLIEYYRRIKARELNNDDIKKSSSPRLYYRDFDLIVHPNPALDCNCIIDEALFTSLSSFVANFYHVKFLTQDKNDDNNRRRSEFLRNVYSKVLYCPCYGRDPIKKNSCSREYDAVNFLCLQDLTSHCQAPCIIDLKIGQITYDPMAIKEKVLEQSSKYQRLREFGFRILGMKLGDEIRGKTYGKTLETTEQVLGALDGFFNPINESEYKCVVIQKILDRLRSLLEWFEKININQLKFFSSSLLIVYDSAFGETKSRHSIEAQLAESVRVSMIDFAHVFHVHDSKRAAETGQRGDENYIFGLKKLENFLFNLNEHHRSRSQLSH